jgi:hypothetical protein
MHIHFIYSYMYILCIYTSSKLIGRCKKVYKGDDKEVDIYQYSCIFLYRYLYICFICKYLRRGGAVKMREIEQFCYGHKNANMIKIIYTINEYIYLFIKFIHVYTGFLKETPTVQIFLIGHHQRLYLHEYILGDFYFLEAVSVLFSLFCCIDHYCSFLFSYLCLFSGWSIFYIWRWFLGCVGEFCLK